MTSEHFSFLPLTHTICTASCYRQSEKMLPFIHTDLLIQYANEKMQPILHFWTLEKTLVLGMKDLRLPHLDQAISFLNENKINAVARNAGGLAVLLDQDVLNISVIFPYGKKEAFSIEAAYEQVYHWLKQTLLSFDLSLVAKEIPDSYCPGTFDLSLSGKKIAGTAQRRVKNATAVMAYLGIKGNQVQRGEQIRQFYQHGLGSAFGTDGYPPVNPNSMSTLNHFSSFTFDLSTLQQTLKNSFAACFQSELATVPIESLLEEVNGPKQLPTLLSRMQKRNEALLQI